MDNELAYHIAEEAVIRINDIIKEVLIKDRTVYTDSFFMEIIMTNANEIVIFYGGVPIWEYHESFDMNGFWKTLSIEFLPVLKDIKKFRKNFKNIQVDGFIDPEKTSFFNLSIIIQQALDCLDYSDLVPVLQVKTNDQKEHYLEFGEVFVPVYRTVAEQQKHIIGICDVSKELYKILKEELKGK